MAAHVLVPVSQPEADYLWNQSGPYQPSFLSWGRAYCQVQASKSVFVAQEFRFVEGEQPGALEFRDGPEFEQDADVCFPFVRRFLILDEDPRFLATLQ